EAVQFAPKLILVPLERLGAAQGFSGSHVMIGYFCTDDNQILPSRPMVVKTLRLVEGGRTEEKNAAQEKLEQEWNSAKQIRLHAAYNVGAFATPLRYDKPNSVLWSPFKSSAPIFQGYQL